MDQLFPSGVGPMLAENASATRFPERSPRVALVCDLFEENWPSMDLVAEMLFQHLLSHHSTEFRTTSLRPAMRRRFTRLPLLCEGRFAFNSDRLLNRFFDYPRWLQHQRSDFDLFHIIDHSYSHLARELLPSRTVITCHDLDTFRCLLHPDHEDRPRWFRAMTRRILQGLQIAAHVITGSAVTRDAILQHGLLPATQVTIVRYGVHPSCSPLPDVASDAEVDRLLPSNFHSLSLLNVGSTIPRKRIDVLLKVFAAVRAEIPGVRLLRVGGPFTTPQIRLARELGVEDDVVVLPSLSRTVLAAVYRRADLLLHTAEAEGFGLPLIEASACGCPVIASDLPVLREVGNSAVTYCPVGDLGAWKESVITLLTEKSQKSEHWNRRREHAIAHAGRFSWAETARQTAAVYRTVLRD
jgi:glycosyltransferase involved in cell wall biosynthesis